MDSNENDASKTTEVSPSILDLLKNTEIKNILMDTTDDFEAFNINANFNIHQNSINESVNEIKSEPVIPDIHASYKYSVQTPITSNQGNNTTK
jgi:hypothetical protein